MLGLPRLLAKARYQVEAEVGSAEARCPWCRSRRPHRVVQAHGVLANGSRLPVAETLMLCVACRRPSIQPSLGARIARCATMLLLVLFMTPPFGGALYFSARVLRGLLHRVTPEPLLAVVLVVGLPASAVGLWIPLYRLIEGLRPGLARIDVPVDDHPPGPHPS